MNPKPFKFFFAAALGLMLFFFVARILFGALIIAAIFSLGFYAFRFMKQLIQKSTQRASVWQGNQWTKVDRLDADLYQDMSQRSYDYQNRTTIEIH